jgi:hypothetical protein
MDSTIDFGYLDTLVALLLYSLTQPSIEMKSPPAGVCTRLPLPTRECRPATLYTELDTPLLTTGLSFIASHTNPIAEKFTMANVLIFLLAIAHAASACQRKLRNREDLQQATNTILSPRQVVEYPPLWTKEEEVLHTSFSNAELATWSSYYTHGDHIAGRNKSMAEETAKKWIANGVPASLVEYEVFLNYPKEQDLVLKWGNGSHYEAQMYEDVLKEDETTGDPGAVPAFHGYSASGKVEAEYIYVG